VRPQRNENEHVDDLNQNSRCNSEHAETDGQESVCLEVSLVHGDVLEGHRREVDFVHREVVEDAGADEPSDLDGPVLRHPVEFSDTLLMVL